MIQDLRIVTQRFSTLQDLKPQIVEFGSSIRNAMQDGYIPVGPPTSFTFDGVQFMIIIMILPMGSGGGGGGPQVVPFMPRGDKPTQPIGKG